jgi:glycosyltransferase involved in cell wall biosynthesis
LLFIARFCKRKGFPKLVQYLKHCYDNLLPFHITVVTNLKGTDVLSGFLSKHPTEFSRCFSIMTSVANDKLIELYSQADCLICTSDTEGFYMPLFESARYNCPVILPRLQLFTNELLNNSYPLYADNKHEFLSCLARLSDPTVNTCAHAALQDSISAVASQ